MPSWADAVVDAAKIVDYLLSAEHPIGADKTTFFIAIGYPRREWSRLRDDLKELPRKGEVVAEEPTPFGVKYVVDGRRPHTYWPYRRTADSLDL